MKKQAGKRIFLKKKGAVAGYRIASVELGKKKFLFAN